MVGRKLLATVILAALPATNAANAQTVTPPQGEPAASSLLSSFVGNYEVAPDHVLGIDLYAEGGPVSLVYSDYRSGVIRRLAQSGDVFEAGTGFGFTEPPEFKIRFVRDDGGLPTSLVVEGTEKTPVTARRLAITSTDVTFTSGDATLAGTLLVPQNSKAPHPAIILLHGSAPLTRYSFGPYPHFFTSIGLAVLTFDKRGAGASTGRYFDYTTPYPNVFANDAIEAVRFLRTRSEIDSARIGLWGASEGGMLTTQVAARAKEVAFIINSSGFMVPLWQQVMFNIEALLKADGFSREDVAEAVAFEASAMRVMQTGDGWDAYSEAQTKAKETKWFKAYFGNSAGFSSLASLQRQWNFVYKFDPLPSLASVDCPVLAVFGALDTSTPARVSADNMRRILAASGNQNVTVKIFQNGNHPLMEAKTGGNAEKPKLGKMAPGVFDTLRTWLIKTARIERVTDGGHLRRGGRFWGPDPAGVRPGRAREYRPLSDTR
jgi:pimeloyl-ACP methyl ester carboxylesterase